MTDPRIVKPQRVGSPVASDACGEHVFWCRKRIAATVLLAVLVLVGVTGLVWWLR